MADHSRGRSSGGESWGQALTALATERIAAVATAPGRAGIGVVRVSGPGLSAFARALCGRELSARHATYTGFLDSAGYNIDQGIAILFAAPHSYTGEDVLELQGHGGEVVQQLLLRRCLELGARLAEPGEFTRRAFLNGKLDLAQAEAVADLIEADSAEAARGAVRSLSGEFSRRVQALAASLVDLRMYVEASIDFPEEEIQLLERFGIVARLQDIADQLTVLLRTARQGSLLRSGLTVVILGRPNVGKSSLLNRLAGEEVAIVTAVPGTTRDTVRERIQIHGVPIHVIDTAGVRSTEDEVERLGIERTWSAASRAQLGLLVTDASEPAHPEDVAIRAQLVQLPIIEVCNKIDLVDRAAEVERADAHLRVFLSARTGAGIELLREELLRAAGWQPVGEGVFTARERHLQALKSALFHVEQALVVREQSELLAEELRQAHQRLGGITGEFTPDDLLGEIFSRFCIGK